MYNIQVTDSQSSSTFDKTAKGRHSKEDTSSSKESILYSVIDEKASETQANLTMGDLEVDLGDKKNSHEKIRTARKENPVHHASLDDPTRSLLEQLQEKLDQKNCQRYRNTHNQASTTSTAKK